jgi:hypothetical protein
MILAVRVGQAAAGVSVGGGAAGGSIFVCGVIKVGEAKMPLFGTKKK